jgi:hypothetical protein
MRIEHPAAKVYVTNPAGEARGCDFACLDDVSQEEEKDLSYMQEGFVLDCIRLLLKAVMGLFWRAVTCALVGLGQ